jgi:class 3 adenylate cyclase
MAVRKILEEIDADVADIIGTDLIHTVTNKVPNRQDAGLTYGKGLQKKGQVLESCVLYVDIRNSVDLTEKHQHKTMGKIYSAFTTAVLKIAQHHNGHIRNIIGDRVMVVFPSENCFVNAVNCAISINHVAQKIINKRFGNVDFKCGIGIDYGKMRVIKVGAHRKGAESGENRALVWVGKPANIASRLTDNANKLVTKPYYEVTRNPKNWAYNLQYFLLDPPFGGMGLNRLPKGGIMPPSKPEPEFLDKVETIEMTVEEFSNSFGLIGTQPYFKEGRLLNFEKKEKQYNYKPILMTEEVFNGYKKANPTGNDITNNWWKEQPHDIKNVEVKIYGADLIKKLD